MSAAPKGAGKVVALNSGTRWQSKLLRTKGGFIKPVLANALVALRDCPSWKGAFRYNSFSLVIELATPPAWARGEARENWQTIPWSDHYDSLLCEWLQRLNIMVNVPITANAVGTVAKENAYHPVQEYLRSLQWDGQPRLATWLSRYLGVPESVYHTAVGERWMIGAVARVLKPGCKMDYALVLQGDQNAGKSTAFQILAGAWFTDEIRTFGTKDTAMGLAGRWIVELGELSAMRESSIELIKVFLSQTMDRFRPPYGRAVVDNPRQCVFGGTTNKYDFLRDETGDRRFWPVGWCSRIDLDALRADRGQLWAEAMALYNSGRSHWLETPELRELAEGEQASRFEADPWERAVQHYLRDKEAVEVEDILSRVLGLPSSEATKADRNRASAVMRRLKWKRAPGERMWRRK